MKNATQYPAATAANLGHPATASTADAVILDMLSILNPPPPAAGLAPAAPRPKEWRFFFAGRA